MSKSAASKSKQQKTTKKQKQQGQTNAIVPVALSAVRVTQAPEVVHMNKRAMRVRHREPLATVTASTAFTVSRFGINPGLAIFDYLSGIATRYEQYRFHSFAIEYVPSSAATRDGLVVLSPEYDPYDASPASKREAMNAEGATEAGVFTNFGLKFDVTSMFEPGPRKFVRADADYIDDLRTSDCGVLYVVTEGGNGAVSGELFAIYDCEFFVARRGDNIRQFPPIAIVNSTGCQISSGNSATNTWAIGNANGIGLTITGSTTLSAPAGGTYIIQHENANAWACSVTGTSIAFAGGQTITCTYAGEFASFTQSSPFKAVQFTFDPDNATTNAGSPVLYGSVKTWLTNWDKPTLIWKPTAANPNFTLSFFSNGYTQNGGAILEYGDETTSIGELNHLLITRIN